MTGMGIQIGIQVGLPRGGAGGGAPVSLQQNVKILFIGDSTTVGVGADPSGLTDYEGSRPFSTPLQAMDELVVLGHAAIADSYTGNNNVGVVANWPLYYDRITTGGTLATSSRSPTAGGILYRLSASTSTIELFTVSDVDTVEFAYVQAVGFGELKFSIDGTEYTASPYETDASPETYVIVQVTGLTLGQHQFKFGQTSGSVHGAGYVNAWDSAAPSFQIINGGSRNWSTSDWVDIVDISGPLNCLPVLDPDIAVIDLGINDYRQSGTTVAQAKANIQTIITKLVSFGCEIILCVPNDIATYNQVSDTWNAAVVLNMYQELIAANAGSVLVNAPEEYFLAGLAATNPAPFSEMNTNGHMYDTLHCKAAPYEVEGKAVAAAVETIAISNGWIS